MTEVLLPKLARFANHYAQSQPPAQVLLKTTKHVLDTIGVAVSAVREPSVRSVDRVSSLWGGKREATALGTGRKLPAPNAALINGTMAHALDFDDTHLPSILHPSASVVPAALAVAESVGASGGAFLTAVAVGNEITCRLGMAGFDSELGNSIYFENGLHATSICGTIGSAAAAALLMGGDEVAITNAMAISASMGAGLLEANRTGGSVKPVHCGWAAHGGITAAQLSLAGLTGPRTVLEGRFGFFRAYSEGRYDRDALVGDLGDRWELHRLFIKPYPTNHFTHAGVDAALALRADGVDPSAITAIEMGLPRPALRTIAEPTDTKAHPQTGHEAKFSGPFTVATALIGGSGLGISAADFTDRNVHDPSRLHLAGLVRCVEDSEATKAFPHQLAANLRIWLRDGSIKEHRVEHNWGGPEHPLSDEELAYKFRLNTEPSLGSNAAEQAIQEAFRLRQATNLQRLVSLLVFHH